MPWKFGAATDIGGRSEQQDRLALLHSQNGCRHLVVVGDGMGGLQSGAKAAQILVDVAEHAFAQHHGRSPYDFLYDICHSAHMAINNLQSDTTPVPGTTALLLYLDKKTAFWAHVGDSRLYHFRKSRLLMHTNDHSLLQLRLRQGLVETSSIAAEEMRHQLYMRLGGEHTPEPDFNDSEVENGDMFLLCSDGLWQAVQPEEMVEALEMYPVDGEGPRYLVDMARRRGGESCDNVSVAISQWSDPEASGRWRRFARFLPGNPRPS